MSTDVTPPVDTKKRAYIIFYILGIGSLLPWNMLYTVDAYWKYKFRNTTSDDDTELTTLQLEWASKLSMASMAPKLIFIFLNAFFGHKISHKPMLITSMVIAILLFVFSDIMTQVNTDEWQVEFLGITLCSVFIINAMVAINQGGLSGLAGMFPSEYMGAVVQGQGLGGIFACASNIIILSLGTDHVGAAFYDFLLSLLFLTLALIAFVILTKSDFYKFYATNDGRGDLNEETLLLKSDEIVMGTLDVGRKVCLWIAAIFINFWVTLSVFPGIVVLVRSTTSGNEWSDTYFIPIGCFLVFNVGDYIGRILAGMLKKPRNSPIGGYWVLGMAVVRVAFLPLFMICNAAPYKRRITDVSKLSIILNFEDILRNFWDFFSGLH